MISAAASVALSFGGTTGVALSGAGAVAINVVLGKSNAYIESSDVRSAGAVTITGTNTSTITATVAAVSVSVAGGGTAAVGVSIGLAIAINHIGSKLDGTSTPMEVKAYVKDSSVSAAGALTLTATAGQTISAIVLAGSVAIAASGTVAVGASGAGVYTDNHVTADVKAYVDGDGTNGISATSITVKAVDTSTITAIAGAASVAAAFSGTVGASLSIAVSLAFNQIGSQVEAAFKNADGPLLTSSQTSAAVKPGDRVRQISTGNIYEFKGTAGTLNLTSETYTDTLRWTLVTTGPVTIEATETATIDAISAAASLAAAIAGVAGIAISGAGAMASNVILTRVNAHIDGSNLKSTGAVSVTATDTSKIRALILAASVAVGGGTVGVGVSIGLALARNVIGWDPAGSTAFTYKSGANVLTLNTGDRIKIEDGSVRGGDIYEYLGTQQTVAFDYTSSSATSTITKGKRVKVLAGVGGRPSDEVYEYIGSVTLVNLNLATQDYSDATKWHQITVLQQDYADKSLWKQVNLTSSAAQLQAYVLNSSIDAAGALTVTATDTATIDAIVVAASVAISAGVVGVGISGAGAGAENRIATDVKAYIDGDGLTGIRAASVSVTSTDSSGINAIVGAASVAAGFGGVGVAVSLGIALAFNEVSNNVAAYIANADQGVTTTSGAVTVSATTQGRFVFNLTGFTQTQLNDAATADSDTPEIAGDEASQDRIDDAIILGNLAGSFSTGLGPLSSPVASSWKFTTADGTPHGRAGRHRQARRRLLARRRAGRALPLRARRLGVASTSARENYAAGSWAKVTVLPKLSILTAGQRVGPRRCRTARPT